MSDWNETIQDHFRASIKRHPVITAKLAEAEVTRPPEAVTVDVLTMKTSAGPDYFVRIRCGGRETTPFKFRERFKAAYEADHLAWVFGLRTDEPDLMAYGPESHPDEPPGNSDQDRIPGS